ncbi:hypothetical protein F4776DRAFT_625265 [Hypoxylon sp. NC0597]|nr:hypothetical protein F4776DRAFT_625265 [Hypoxylon sp. NC0597]
MGGRESVYSRRLLLILLFAFAILSFRYTTKPSSSSIIIIPSQVGDADDNNKMADLGEGDDNVISKLKVSVRQVSASPPKLGIAVTNTHSGAVTILSWNSPLDPLALQLGLVSFVPAGSDSSSESPIHIPSIQIRRKMPPGPESLITVGAGQTKEQELELKAPIVPLEKLRGRRASVVCEGEWISVWPSEADAITKESLEKAGASEDAFRGRFKSEAVEIEI